MGREFCDQHSAMCAVQENLKQEMEELKQEMDKLRKFTVDKVEDLSRLWSQMQERFVRLETILQEKFINFAEKFNDIKDDIKENNEISDKKIDDMIKQIEIIDKNLLEKVNEKISNIENKINEMNQNKKNHTMTFLSQFVYPVFVGLGMFLLAKYFSK